METLRMLLVRFGPYLAALAGILVAAVANGMETGIYRLNRIRLRLRAEAGDRRARALVGLLATCGASSSSAWSATTSACM